MIKQIPFCLHVKFSTGVFLFRNFWLNKINLFFLPLHGLTSGFNSKHKFSVFTAALCVFQLKGLEQENAHLSQTVSSLRQRCQVGAEARVKDVEKENRVLHESICETTAKLNKMEFERKQLREWLVVS